MKKKCYIWLSITSILFIFWAINVVMVAYNKQIYMKLGLGEFVSDGIPIVIIFGLFIPVVISAMVTGNARSKALGGKQ